MHADARRGGRALGRGEGCRRRGGSGGEEEEEVISGGFGGQSEPVEVRGVTGTGGGGRGSMSERSVEVLHIMER